MANTGIMHLAYKPGTRPYCNTRRSIMSTTPSEAQRWPRICVKCAAKYSAMKARQAARSIYDATGDTIRGELDPEA